ncbi:MAG TPA: DUF1761 domain-containing protein [Candidatus Saccharimonadales bacterium]|nr:DUF1761 domain-containing protein [Candidatus Saccharimonadales bacterium]
MFDLTSLNWLAILLATVVYFMLGGLWFASFAFQKLWDISVGFNRSQTWRPGLQYYTVPFIGCFVISLATALLLDATKVQSFANAITLGLITGVGYAAAITGILAISPTIPRPGVYTLVIGSSHVIGIVGVSVIIFALK